MGHINFLWYDQTPAADTDMNQICPLLYNERVLLAADIKSPEVIEHQTFIH